MNMRGYACARVVVVFAFVFRSCCCFTCRRHQKNTYIFQILNIFSARETGSKRERNRVKAREKQGQSARETGSKRERNRVKAREKQGQSEMFKKSRLTGSWVVVK
jgi:hypothetical protein